VPQLSSVPAFDEESATTPPSAAPNGPRNLQQLAEAEEVEIASALEVQITKLVQRPPCPPGLVPKTLPQTHPLSQLQQQRVNEQLACERSTGQPRPASDPASSGLQQILSRLRQNFPERQGYYLPTDNTPVVVRHDPSTAPSVLVPLSIICQHCGAVNLLVKDPLTDQIPSDAQPK
jgi:hypothetical protein